MLDRFAASAPVGDAGFVSFVLQGFPKPVGVVAFVRQQPVRPGQAPEQRQRTRIVADLASRQEEPDRPSFIRNGVELCVQPTLRAPDEPPARPFLPAG